MNRRAQPVGILVLVCALMLVGQVPARATDPDADQDIGGGAGSGDDQRALDLVRQSATAAGRLSYAGTQYVSAWSELGTGDSSTSAVVQVLHEAGGDTTIQVQGRESAILEGRDGATWLAGGGGPAELLAGAYDVRLGGVGEVAGRTADIVEARRHDGSVAARFWLDRETALSVRRETFGTDGTLLSASAYVELAIKAMHPCCVDNGPTEVRVDEAALRDVDLDRMRRAGWHCPEHLGDGLTLYEARVLGEAVHLSYSDGVMTVSIFEQPGRLDPASLDGYTKTTVGDGVIYASAGPPARFTWSTGGRVVTVVADAPLEVIESVLRDMPPEASPAPKPDDGFFARISRGASRVASWLNPFD